MIVALLALVVLFAVTYAFDTRRDRDRARGQLVAERATAAERADRMASAHYEAMGNLLTLDREERDLLHQRAQHHDAASAAERREAAQERTDLLNRIQDPVAGVAMSIARLPAPGDLDVEFER